MIPLLAVLEFKDYAIIAVIVAVFASGAAYTSRQEISLISLELELKALRKKVDALLKFHSIQLPEPPPSGLSREVEQLASHPATHIAAIKLYRQQNPGVGLAEAKSRVEEYYTRSV